MVLVATLERDIIIAVPLHFFDELAACYKSLKK